MPMNILLLIVLATVVTVLSAENINIKLLYGTSKVLFCDDNGIPDTWLFSNDLSSTAVTLSNNDNSIEFDGDSIVKVKNLSANDEGLYWCEKDNEILKSFNLTILGITTFAGCLPPVGDNPDNCDSGSVLTYSLGDTIAINISWYFFGGGLRNGKQNIERISLKYANNDLVSCEMGENCNGIERIEFEYPNQNSIQVSIKNATISDSGVYTAEARVSTQNYIKPITWSVKVNVTSVEDPIVTVTSTTIISSTNGLQDSIPIMTTLNDGNAMTSMTSINIDSTFTSQTIDKSSTNSTSQAMDISNPNASNTTSKKQQEMIVIVVGVIISSLVLIILIIIVATVITCFIRRRCQFVSFMSAKSKFASVADHLHVCNKISLPDKISMTNGSSYANSFLSVPTDHQAIYEQRVLHSAAQDSSYLSNDHNSKKVTV